MGRECHEVKSHCSYFGKQVTCPHNFCQDCSYQIKVHFSIQTTKFLMKYDLLCFKIVGRLIIFFTKHDY